MANRWAVATVVSVVVAVAGGVAVGRAGEPTRVVAAASELAQPPSGWVADADPELGWTFERPATWTVQRYTERCRVGATGTVVSNLGREVAFLAPPGVSCSTRWDLAAVPDGFVGVQLSHHSGGAPTIRMRVEPPDTPFPLSMAGAEPAPPTDEAQTPEPPSRVRRIQIQGDARYLVRVWVGPAASPEDMATAERVVATIRITEGPGDGPPPLPRQCPAVGVVEPVVLEGMLCSGEPPAGNGLGVDGRCTGREPGPPCGAGAEPGRYYPYTLPLRCDGLAYFDGRPWYSQLPPPTDGGTTHVWMRLDPSGDLGFVSPRGAVGFTPDPGPARCSGPPARSGGPAPPPG